MTSCSGGDTNRSPLLCPVRPVGPVAQRPLANAAAIVGGFWAERLRINATASIREGWAWLGRSGSLVNFGSVAAGERTGFIGEANQDAETYKWVEAAAHEVARSGDKELRGWLDEAVATILSAQDKSGYLHTWHQLNPDVPRYHGVRNGGPDETYTAGLFLHAAVAHARATGQAQMIEAAFRLVQCLQRELFAVDLGSVPGHPGLEMGLVELFRETGDRSMLDLARTLVKRRGHGWLGNGRFGSSHYQDFAPVCEQSTLTGHAVAGLYLMAGATDLAMESGDAELLDALEQIWSATVARRMHITGGIGSRAKNEDVGDDFELSPDSAYCETCASIALVMWSWRLLLATGKARYAGIVERTLLNGVLVGVSEDGHCFRYDNPLQVRGGFRTPAEHRHDHRAEWFELACCPPNLMRLLASFGHYVATTDANGGLTIQQLATARLDWSGAIVEIDTTYPHAGDVTLRFRGEERTAGIRIRVPEWVESVSVNGAPATLVDGYLPVGERWSDGAEVHLHLEWSPRLTTANTMVDSLRGAAAMECGPFVYCVEQVDVPVPLDGLRLSPDKVELTEEHEASGATRLSGRFLSLQGGDGPLYGPLETIEPTTTSVHATAIPYYRWGNREVGPMRVWIPLSD